MGKRLGFYVPVFCALPRDPKLHRTAKDLGTKDYDMVRSKIENLWMWTMENHPTGNLGPLTPEEIAEYSNWRGNAEKWRAALINRHWLDLKPDGSYFVHEWELYAGRLLDAIEYNNLCQNARRNQLVQAFEFCHAPSKVAKYNAIQDLIRQGVPEQTIIESAAAGDRQGWDFYSHIKALTPNHKPKVDTPF